MSTLDEFTPGVTTSDTRKRIQTHADLVTYLRDPCCSISCLEIDEFIGSYDDWQALNPSAGLGDESNKKTTKSKPKKEKTIKQTAIAPAVSSIKKLSYNEKRELEQLPKEIEALEEEIAQLHQIMSDSNFYQQDQKKIKTITETLQKIETLLEKKYARWEVLDD